ncbi:unnamed protein product [Allacma fusca]|uniref:Uncharacterized protein n=1 Tax=Allacma fusca TaxID=39272 RepID=A0A8J2JC38_9HEXA|nr:unnamed protein product [Allacma fusca]
MGVPCDEFDGKVVYGQKQAQPGSSANYHLEKNFILIVGVHRTGVQSSENLLQSILRQAVPYKITTFFGLHVGT